MYSRVWRRRSRQSSHCRPDRFTQKSFRTARATSRSTMQHSGETLPDKCPCCNNPWARATADLFAKMCAECTETTTSKNTTNSDGFGLSRDNLDESVDRTSNFLSLGQWQLDEGKSHSERISQLEYLFEFARGVARTMQGNLGRLGKVYCQ